MNKKIILMFHQVNSSEWFEHTITSISKKYSLVSSDVLHSMLTGEKKTGAYCNITFDDGHKSFYEKVFPILKKHNLPATLFVSPLKTRQRENFWFQQICRFDKVKFHYFVASRVQKHFKEGINDYSVHAILKSLRIATIEELIIEFFADNHATKTEFMNVREEQLLEMKNSGLVEIGAHTQNHPILANEDDETANNEIMDSVSELSIMLDSKIKYFAYPNGQPGMDFKQREINTLKEAGIKLAYSTESSSIKSNSRLHALPRIGISKGSKRVVFFKINNARLWGKSKNIIHRNSEHNDRIALKKIKL